MPEQVRIGWRPYVDSGLDVSATAFSNASGITDATQKSAINTLVKDLKRFGLWSKIKAFYPFVGGTAESHKWNLIDPRDLDAAYRLTFSGGWTHNTSGIKGNNTNTIADTKLSLRTVFGATSNSYTLGIYINENPTGMSYRSDIGAADGPFNWSGPQVSPIIGWFNTNTLVYTIHMPSDQWASYSNSSPANVAGLSELKRYKSNYANDFYNGLENGNRRTTINTTNYNPVTSVTIGSQAQSGWVSYSTNRYSSAYIGEALSSLESYLMYITVQKFNTTLNRHVGTGISPINLNTYSTAPALVTTGLKMNLDVASLSVPLEGAYGTNTNSYWGVVTGNYFLNNDIWTDSSGNGNNGTFWSSVANANGDKRSAQYFIEDELNIPELRFRDYNNPGKIFKTGNSADAVLSNYKGSDTSDFTFGGWVKVNSEHSIVILQRGNESLTGGSSLMIYGSLNNKIYVNHNGWVAGAQSSTTMAPNTWYHVYAVWKRQGYTKLYVNGVLQSTVSATSYTSLISSGTGFGMNSMNLSSGMGRSIVGSYQVYDRELSGTEIKQNFDSNKSKYNVVSSEDTDTQAFITAAGITDATQASAVTTLVTSLKTAGIWTKMKAIYPFVGGTAQSHKFNLKDPRDADAAYRLVFNGGWTHTSTGALPNGTTGYADTKLIPSSTLNLNSTHISVYLNTNYSGPGSTDVVDMGVEDASYTNRLFIEPSTNGNVYSINNSNGYSYINTSDSNSLGLYVNNRISSTAINLFKNNIKLINDTARISSGLSVRPLYIGAHNFVGSASYLSSRRQAFASMGDGLTDAEALAFYNAVQAFQTTLGRAV